MKNLLSAAFLLIGMTATAQTITFDTDDYKSLGVYDTWEESPFRLGQLKGNVGITTNFLNQPDELGNASPNQSTKMLAVQRSRFGSNTFGARIDMKETFELTTSYKYIHVMIWKPTAGRVMLVGLGKRPERTGQSAETEQFWALATSKVQANTWTDAVFAIKGNGGIDIHSLVVVPDCESTHNLTSDYLCYIDEITVNDSSTPRFRVQGDYALNYDNDQSNPRSDRYLNTIALSAPSNTDQKVGNFDHTLLYNDKTAFSFQAKPGETVTPTFSYAGTWMSGYVYADWDVNGKLEYDINADGTPAANSNLVSYSYYCASGDGMGTNSSGASVANGNVLNPPTFIVPDTLVCGFYRMRYKVDWNCIDPAGNAASDNQITSNGGAIVDVLLNVHGDYCNVNDANRNGEVLSASDDAKLVTYKTPFGKPFTIRMNPERGFEYAGIKVRHGYNLAGDSLVHGNPQYQDTTFSYNLFENDEFTIPAECMDGDVQIEGLFVQEGTLPKVHKVTYNVVDEEKNILRTYNYKLSEGDTYPTPTLESECSSKYWSVEAVPTELAGQNDTIINLQYTNKFPFEVSTSMKSARWYNLMLSASQYYLYYNTCRMWLSETPSTKGIDATQPKYLWCFVGNAFDGFRIQNAVSHESQVLASPTEMWGSTGGSTYANMITWPYMLENTYNDAWTVIESSNITDGFYLQQKGFTSNKLNLRDSNLAYWTGGADAGSTFTIQKVGKEEDLQTENVPYSVVDDTYELIFDDEFNDDAINKDYWRCADRLSAAWNRFICDDSRVAYLSDGNLVCRCFKNDGTYGQDGDMVSGAQITKGKFSFTNGYVEVRAKTHPYSGNFPAIWLMPEDVTGGWPICGEIDIWETVNTESTAFQTVHTNWTYTLGNKTNPTSAQKIYCIQDGEWHTYGLMKSDTTLVWYIDGVQVASYNKADLSEDALDNTAWPFCKKYYVILNQSVGNGSWAYTPDINHTYETLFDFCRVYQTEEEAIADGNKTTGIESVNGPNISTRIHDLSGRVINSANHNLRKGVYIKNGYKFMVK